MYQRDYFLRLTQELSKLIAKLAGLKEKGETKQMLQILDEAYRSILQIDPSYLKKIVSIKSIENIRKQREISNEQLEIAARFLFEEAEILQEIDEKTSQKKYKSAAVILNFLNHDQKIYSFEREDLLSDIQKKLIKD